MTNLEIEKYKIAGGNQTALVRGCQPREYLSVSKKILASGNEQVGFVSTGDRSIRGGSLDRLTMMGGELCVNACLAMARSASQATSLKIGSFMTNGKKVDWRDFPEGPNIDLGLHFSVFKKAKIPGRIVLLEDIGYRVTTGNERLTKRQLRSLCKEFEMPAFGDIQRQGRRIKPYVYVSRTDTLIAETACGSGSIASVLSAGDEFERKQIKNVEQPTGQVIGISGPKDGGMSSKFNIFAKVQPVF